jgi:hypothetical protein
LKRAWFREEQIFQVSKGRVGRGKEQRSMAAPRHLRREFLVGGQIQRAGDLGDVGCDNLIMRIEVEIECRELIAGHLDLVRGSLVPEFNSMPGTQNQVDTNEQFSGSAEV